MKIKTILFAFLFSQSILISHATEATGPVATNCSDEIQKYCSDKTHGHGEVRDCLLTKKDLVSQECKKTLETTGPGKGAGKGKGTL